MTPNKVGGFLMNVPRNVSAAYALMNSISKAALLHIDVNESLFSTNLTIKFFKPSKSWAHLFWRAFNTIPN